MEIKDIAQYHEQIASTNDLARDPRYGHGAVIVAESQTRGRGQQGNSWASEPGKNLTISIVLTPDFLPAADQFYLLQAVSLAVADSLTGLDARIKWPNDIYIGERKIAGLLIENDIMGSNISRSVVGIGLNVNQTVFPAWVPNPTSLKTETGRTQDRVLLLQTLLRNLTMRYRTLQEGNTQSLRTDYHDRLYRLGTEALYAKPDGTTFRGTIMEVAPTGELLVEHLSDGNRHAYLFKEIEFR